MADPAFLLAPVGEWRKADLARLSAPPSHGCGKLAQGEAFGLHKGPRERPVFDRVGA